MNRILILVLFALAVFSSCEKDDSPIFEKTSDERLTEALASYQKVLTDAPNGWKAYVHPNGVGVTPSELGGFTFYFKFTNANRVFMLSDFDNVSSAVVKESSYRLKALQQPALVFDTYSYIHTLSDPNPNVSFGWTGRGWASDFEFGFDRVTSDTIDLTGRFNGVKVTLIKLKKEEEDAFKAGKLKTILESSMTYGAANQFLSFAGANNSKAAVAFDYNMLVVKFAYLDASGNLVAVNAPFSHTLDGVHFKFPVTVNGFTFQDMYWDATKSVYYITVNGNKTELVNGTVPPLPLNKLIGSTYTTISVPTTALPGQSTLFTSKYNAVKLGVKNGGYNLDLGIMDFIFNATNKTMTISAIMRMGTNPFTFTWSYTYTTDNNGLVKFTRTGNNTNAGLVEANMRPLLDNIENDRFKLDYFTSGTTLLGQFTSQESPTFFFTGNLK